VDAPRSLPVDDVLTQPTRWRLFSLLGELKRPAATLELAERLGLHANGVRVHLERMEQAGLLARARVRHGRGRPSDEWTVAATARPGGSAPCAYRDLGVWLARAIGPARALRGVENTGRQIGRELAPKPTDPPAAALQSSLSALGFQPTLDVRPPGRATFRLGNCPYRDAVHENQPAICALHKGITRGLLDVLAPGVRLTGFVPQDPDSAGCVIELNAVGDRAV
jgi:predicted ArsR family transcriptional regulator